MSAALVTHGDLKLYYATRDGQSQRIAAHIADRLNERNIPFTLEDLASTTPTPASLAHAALLVVVASVRYGRHLPEADRFLATCRASAWSARLVLASVNLTARKPGKDTVEGNAYLRKSIARHGLTPVLAVALAGRLDYARYRWLDRQIIRCIMRLTGGPTAPDTRIEYTSWAAVDRLAWQIAELRAAG